jgi:hypothetical protein
MRRDGSVSLVCTTLVGTGSAALNNAVSHDHDFTTVILAVPYCATLTRRRLTHSAKAALD